MKRSRLDMKEKSIMEPVQETSPKEGDSTEDLTLDTKVTCFVCGKKGQLRRLITHQMTAHSALQFIPPEPKAITCNFCKHAMPSTSLDRHLKRKHPAEYSKLQKQKIAQTLATPIQPVITKPVVKIEQVPRILEYVPKKEPEVKKVPKIEVIEPVPEPTIIIKKQSTVLSVEEDDDGFFDLVITEFSDL